MSGVIGVTGGIGSGKSAVCRYLVSRYGFAGLDVDNLAALLLRKDEAGWTALSDAFGSLYFNAAGEVDRPKLRRDLFSDVDLRRRIDALLHPLIWRRTAESVSALRKNGRLILVEVPLLYEAGWLGRFDRVVVVYADQSSRVRRVMARDSIAFDQAMAALTVQQSLDEKTILADHVIDNSGAWACTCLLLDHFASLLASLASLPPSIAK